jgi:hypothetical protein
MGGGSLSEAPGGLGGRTSELRRGVVRDDVDGSGQSSSSSWSSKSLMSLKSLIADLLVKLGWL